MKCHLCWDQKRVTAWLYTHSRRDSRMSWKCNKCKLHKFKFHWIRRFEYVCMEEKSNQCKWHELASKAIQHYFGWKIKKHVRKERQLLTVWLSWIIFQLNKPRTNEIVVHDFTFHFQRMQLNSTTVTIKVLVIIVFFYHLLPIPTHIFLCPWNEC